MSPIGSPNRHGHVKDRILMVVGMTLALAGCGQAPPLPSQAVPEPPAPTTSPMVGSVSDEDLAEAVRFREAFGLRADSEWINAVADDPLSEAGRADFGVPLLPFERADLLGRRTNPDLAVRVANYGAVFPESFGGVIFDQRAGAALVAHFSGDVERHRRALGALIPGAVVDVRQVDWSLADLESFIEQVEAERDWFPAIGTRYFTSGIDVSTNRVTVRFDGPDPAASEQIEDHFGKPGWLAVEWNGPLPWTGPRGTLVVHATDPTGAPVPDLWIDYTPDDPAALDGESFVGTTETGRAEAANIPAGWYVVEVKRRADDGWVVVDERRVNVTGGTRTVVDVTVEAGT